MRTNTDLASKLLSLKRRLEEQQSRRAEMQGELKSLLRQMEQDFGVTTIPEAEALLHKMKQELDEMEQSIRERIAEVEDMMEGNPDD